jgi:hypothetical protein
VDPYWCDYAARDSDAEYIEDPEAVDTVKKTGVDQGHQGVVDGNEDTPMENA